ncbi:dihydrolipoyl dehydrogenase family protein [Nocardioides acrostichi]|uniref:FAD-dependent oxidoreductase n=1 Tax=Nocardioides acrostichi TaxID=2784339 RepID=A0A930Y6B3_9ACTN|nr:FAD-dependent oxidoreductase [Nocardioides acrostichi]MBF4162170.1 FAD-dependent oxidoreductase [Nocardioides acrostichi]
MVDEESFDVIVLGIGSGGELAARKLARAGLSVAGVESRLVGGECPFWGCTPSKLLIRSADALAEARRAGELSGEVSVTPSLAPAAARIREANHDWHDDAHAEPLDDEGVTIVRGHGRLDGTGRVRVQTDDGERVLVGERGVVVNTGTKPAAPPIDGLDDTPFWTNRDIFELTEAPESMAVIGGGPIGCELAQTFARFGTAVTLIEVAPRILMPEEPESAELMCGVLSDDGIDLRAAADVERVSHDGRCFTIVVDGEEVVVDRLLVAAGRHQNLDDIGLETVGLDPEATTIEVDERCRAGERLWAVGDITGHGAFTHVSLYQGDVVVRDLLGEEGPWAEYHGVSRVTFTDPEVGSVGLTEEQAREQGIEVVTGLADIGRDSRGWIHGAEGLVKVVADADRGVLVGASVVAPYGGEVLGLLSAAVHARIPVATLRGMHFAYPTFHRTIRVALHKTGL